MIIVRHPNLGVCQSMMWQAINDAQLDASGAGLRARSRTFWSREAPPDP